MSDDPRQILAIMFTDVVGYTALTERDEAAAVRVRRQHRELLQTLVGQFDGELVDVTGDESFSVFPSALRAVDCALAIQGALQSYTDLRLRIGIHLGDVLRRDGEVVGEGVNVAARVRPLAEPGGIVVSEPVYQMIRTRPHVSAKALGPQHFKNVGQPISVFALSTAATPAARTGARRHPMRWIAGVAALAIVAMLVANRDAILAWAALTAPRWFGSTIEQEIGFTETTDGVRIAYAASGEGLPIVMVLGWLTHLTEGIGSPLYDRGDLIGSLSREHRFVRYDGRGFGLSDRNVDDFSLEARLRDIDAVVAALGLERFALFGTSAGGPAAVAYAARHPEQVSHLVLAGTFAGASGARTDRVGGVAFEKLFDIFESSWESPMARASMAEFLAPEAGGVERQILMHFLLISGNGNSIAGFLRSSRTIDVSDVARTVRVPALVVAGDADRTVPLDATRHLASLIPGARFEILEGASHVEAAGRDPRLVRQILEFTRTDANAPIARD